MSRGSPECERAKGRDATSGDSAFLEEAEMRMLTSGVGQNDSRASSIATTGEWEDPECWLASAANSESFPVSSSAGTSPLTGTPNQDVSPGIAVHLDQSFSFCIPDQPEGSQSLSSISDVLQVEKDFMDYVMSFPAPVAASAPTEINGRDQVKPTATAATTRRAHQSEAKVGLDHLDNLCKLMEQLSDLKESNIKLKRRVQYLEDIKTLHEIHKEMVGERILYSSGVTSDEDVMRKRNHSVEKAERGCLEQEARNLDGLYRSKTQTLVPSAAEYKFERGHKSRSVSSNKERRERSKSVGHAKTVKKHPSRWSKVKEVLGIEKTDDQSTTLEAEKSDDPSVGRHQSGERRDRDPFRSTRKDVDYAKSHKLSTSKSHSSILSSRSFTEISRQGAVDAGLKKSPKTPWGKMKTMIQIRRDNRQKSESSSSSPLDPKAVKAGQQEPAGTGQHHPAAKRNNTGRQNHNRHAEGQQDTTSPADHQRTDKYLEGARNGNLHHLGGEREELPQRHHQQRNRRSDNSLERDSKLPEVGASQKNHHDEYIENIKKKKPKHRPVPLDSLPNEPQQILFNEEDSRGVPKSPGCSPLAQRKWMWTKMKDVLKGKKEDIGEHISCSVPSSPVSVAEGAAFDFEIVDKTEDSSLNSVPQSARASESGPGNSAPLPCSASPSSTVAELLRELQQNLSDDFNKKLEEWQKCRAEGGAIKCPPSPLAVERKDSFGRLRKISKPEKKVSTSEKANKSLYHVQKKDLSWLEKEHQKVEREIVRLSKEKEKFEKRAFRLLHLKEAMVEGDGLKKEVLVKTSAGEFRFEGISDAFTKKLYEWETKKGVGPELSTIALLDESLKPSSTESPLVSPSVVVQQVGSNSTRPSPEPKNCFQVSRASSEPDLFSSSQKESGSVSGHQATRCKSGDTLLAGDNREIALEEGSTHLESPREVEVAPHHGDDNYYSLLEENMYLLDQLKEKEEICGHLQNELDRLDDRTEKANRLHQEEMEKCRQKLWEIHMSRPRDLQGSLQLISELKSRIEELQKCSDKLKSDREQLEESFRYHSDQQARLADDLIRRVRELQETPVYLGRGGCRRKWRKMMKCDSSSVTRIHDLSTKLLQQARDVEQTLMERTRQVCHLRWELLHRDMSAVLLQAALHRVTSQGEPLSLSILPTWDKRRSKFKSLKAWSVDTTSRSQSQDGVADDWLQDRLRQLSMTPYSDWTSIDFTPNDLMTTAHELKRETLKLSIARPDRVSDSEDKKSATCSADSELADSDSRYCDTGSAVNSRSSSLSSGGMGGLRGSHSDTRLYERARALRRNSSSSMSCVEASDSSSVQDSDRMHCMVKRFPWRSQWRSLDNVSSSCSSRSSVLEEDSARTHWRQPKSSGRIEVLAHEEGPLQLKYGSFKEVDEENEDSKSESAAAKSADWASHCLITPRPLHLGRGSDSERDKQKKTQGAQKKIFGRSPNFTSHKIIEPPPTPLYGRMISQTFNSSAVASRTGSVCSSQHESMMREFKEFTSSVATSSRDDQQNNSLESLDNYETAIRDEDLLSDEHSARSGDEHHRRNLAIFAAFEDSLKRSSSSSNKAFDCPREDEHSDRSMTSGDERYKRDMKTIADFEDSLKKSTSVKAFDFHHQLSSKPTHGDEGPMIAGGDHHRSNLQTFEESLKHRTFDKAFDQHASSMYGDEQTAASSDEHYRRNLETFADFENSLKRRTTSKPPDHQTSSSSAVASHACISDYIHRDRVLAGECGGNQTAPGSPNISKFKYKGTKGFGKTARQTYNDNLTFRPHKCQNQESLRPSDSDVVHLDI